MLLESIQIIHLSGKLDWPEVEANRTGLTGEQRSFYRAYEYLHDRMGAAYQAADLVVARAGASMLGESPAFGVPTILVPYPYAWRYQKINADYLVSRGAATRLDDNRLTEDLAPTILSLLGNEEKLDDMSHAAKKLDRPDAAEKISSVLIEISKRAIP
jgi:UDP-N-acetylglucosamine--N-acetylmuramyl-(pentapeptide) pyrophosphoryl-undecaprenol N-acetylglucosamine transferase